MGVFHGEVVGSICPAANCSCTNREAADNFSSGSGHWSTQTGESSFHFIFSAWGAGGSMAAKKNPDCRILVGQSWVLWREGFLFLGQLFPIPVQGDSLD